MTDQIGALPAPDPSRGAVAARQWLLALCHRHRLSPTQRRVAHVLADTMPHAAFLSTSEAAALAGASQATVTRFAATLGFATYAGFRQEVRGVVLGADADQQQQQTAVGPVGPAGPVGPVGLVDPVDAAAEARETLTVVGATLASPALRDAVAAVAAADALAVVGMRASAALAAYVGYFARRILDDVRVVTDADAASDALTQMSLAGSGAVLVVAMPRHPASTVRALRRARALGLATVLVVDSPLVDFADDADHVLVAPVGVSLVFDTHAAPILVLGALLDGLARARPRRTQDRLEAHEQLVETWVHGGEDPSG